MRTPKADCKVFVLVSLEMLEDALKEVIKEGQYNNILIWPEEVIFSASSSEDCLISDSCFPDSQESYFLRWIQSPREVVGYSVGIRILKIFPSAFVKVVLEEGKVYISQLKNNERVNKIKDEITRALKELGAQVITEE